MTGLGAWSFGFYQYGMDVPDRVAAGVLGSVMTGLGAWSFGFYQYGMDVPNDRVAAGVLAFKRALADNGYGKNVDLTLAKFGSAMRKRTREFQAAQGIGVDGVIGPTTSRYLMRHYAYAVELAHNVPDHRVIRLGGAESGHDPVAQGYVDPDDEGEVQVHLSSHPNVTIQQAWDPAFSFEFAGKGLQSFHDNQVADWDGATASWNVGQFYAKQWVLAGKPTHGLFVNGVDIYARAYNYNHMVLSQPV